MRVIVIPPQPVRLTYSGTCQRCAIAIGDAFCGHGVRSACHIRILGLWCVVETNIYCGDTEHCDHPYRRRILLAGSPSTDADTIFNQEVAGGCSVDCWSCRDVSQEERAGEMVCSAAAT